MSKSKRVVFSFDERSYESLEKMKKEGKYPSMGNAVKDSLTVTSALQDQAKQGFREIIVRNPATNEERVMVIPILYQEGDDSED